MGQGPFSGPVIGAKSCLRAALPTLVMPLWHEMVVLIPLLSTGAAKKFKFLVVASRTVYEMSDMDLYMDLLY